MGYKKIRRGGLQKIRRGGLQKIRRDGLQDLYMASRRDGLQVTNIPMIFVAHVVILLQCILS